MTALRGVRVGKGSRPKATWSRLRMAALSLVQVALSVGGVKGK